ncbi:MAG: hypothetical protein BGO26_06720 [Actinobacteria bacterium 69-20]|nr:hypothetical protein [Actinomycetota bacterium]OJV28127.1 MAG: hypothetical protein BGO26_06720 [Actinobacteria bacterium 69-20]
MTTGTKTSCGSKAAGACTARTRHAVRGLRPDGRAGDLRPLWPFRAAKVTKQLVARGYRATCRGDFGGQRATIGRTARQQILGCMNDQAFAIRWIIEQD